MINIIVLSSSPSSKRAFLFMCPCWKGCWMGCWVWMVVACPCLPVRNDIVTPRHLFSLFPTSDPSFLSIFHPFFPSSFLPSFFLPFYIPSFLFLSPLLSLFLSFLFFVFWLCQPKLIVSLTWSHWHHPILSLSKILPTPQLRKLHVSYRLIVKRSEGPPTPDAQNNRPLKRHYGQRFPMPHWYH